MQYVAQHITVNVDDKKERLVVLSECIISNFPAPTKGGKIFLTAHREQFSPLCLATVESALFEHGVLIVGKASYLPTFFSFLYGCRMCF